MTDYSPVIQTGLALIAIIIISFIIFKFEIVPPKHIGTLNKFLLLMCYFPLIFHSIGSTKIKEINFMPFVIGLSSVITYAILLGVIFFFPLKDRFDTYLSTYVSTTYVNYLVIGPSIFDSIWDPSDEINITILNLSNDIVCCTVYLILSNIYLIIKNNKLHKEFQDGKEEHFNLHTISQIGLRLIKNPIIIGNIVGFIWTGIGFKQCPFLWDIMEILKKCVTCLSMICVGGFISQHSIIACNFVHFVICLILRHFVYPLIIAIYCSIYHVSGKLSRQCIIMATMPTATVSFIFSCEFGISPGVASTLILWTCIFCVPATIAWISILNSLKLFNE